MPFTVVVLGIAERGVYAALADMIGAGEITSDGGTTRITVRDQSELVSILARLNDLGVPVGEVLQGHEPGPGAAALPTASPSKEQR